MAKPKVFPIVALVLLAGAAWLVYGRALDAPFIYDDAASVNNNGSIVELWPLIGEAEHHGPLNPPDETTTSGRPLVNLSLAINYHFGRLNPAGYHAFNLLVHVLSALLLMAIVERTLRLDYFAERFPRASAGARWLAFFAALLWMVHPLQTETVVYVTQRTELMVGFFYLATLYASLRYWAVSTPAARTSWLAIATFTCLAGMACKEVMVSAPVVVLLFERTFVKGSFGRALARSWPLYVGLALGWALLLWLNWGGPRSDTAGFALEAPASVWWLTQAKVLWTYLKLCIWPWPLSIHYQAAYLSTFEEAWPWVVATVLLVVLTTVLVWRRNAVGFVSAWTLIILSPTLVVPIVTELMAERRMYLPLAAIATLAVVGGYWVAQQVEACFMKNDVRRKAPTARSELMGIIACSIVAAMLSLISVRRLEAYHDELTLWQDDVIHQPDDPIAHYNLGEALDRGGRTTDAVGQYLIALRLKPDYPDAYNNLGRAYASAGRWAEATEQYRQALRYMPRHADAHNNLGNALSRAGQLQEAVGHYEQALRLKPRYAAAHYNLGLALDRLGRTEEAIEQYQKAIEINQELMQAHQNLALALAEVHRLREAVAAADIALELARSQGQTAVAEQISRWLAANRKGESGVPEAQGASQPATGP